MESSQRRAVGTPPQMDRIISWNVRGMNSPQKQEDIKLFLHQQPTGMVGFLETKVKEENMTQVVGRVCNNWHWVHNADSMNRGRVLVCWHPQSYNFQVTRQTDQLIHGRALQLSTNKSFFITFVYEETWGLREILYGMTWSPLLVI